ncbi:MAG: DNA internalization-related competence protein ComEC/Rec2 [Candidatus Scatovivens sp.]
MFIIWWGLYIKNIALFIFANFIIIIFIKLKFKINIKFILVILIISNLLYFRIEYLEKNFRKTYDNISECNIVAEIVSNVEEKEYTNKYIIKVININKKNKYKNTKLILYSKNSKYKYGDIIYINGKYDEPISQRNKNGFDYRQYLKQERIYGIIFSKDDKKIDNKNSISQIIYKLNNNMSNILYNLYDKEQADILNAMLLGNKKNLEEETKSIFKNSSLSHILAISGLHINYIAEILRKILDKIINSKMKKNLLIIIFLIFFCIFSGASPSCVRACLMIFFLILADILFRKNDKINSICFSLIFILLLNPYYIQNVGLWLSFGGIIGINLFKDIIRINNKNKLISYIVTNSNLSFSVQIMIAPIILYNFNNLSFTFFISNIFVSFFVLPIIVLGYLSIFFGAINIYFAKYTVVIFQKILLNIILLIAKIISKLKLSNIILTTPTIIAISSYYIAVLLIRFKKINLRKNTHKIVVILFVIVIVFNFVFIKINNDLEIHFIDVGQGDCSLIITPSNKKILIDAGEGGRNTNYDYGKNVVLPYLLDKKILVLDYIMISHFDSDHVRRNYTYIKKYKS